MERTPKATRAKYMTDKVAGLASSVEVHRALTCPYRKLNPDVLMVQSDHKWQSQCSTEWLDGARCRRILFAWR
jgi:hypothetical protein